MSSSTPFAVLGSLLAHAAFGAAVVGFGPVSEQFSQVQAPVELVFQTIEPLAQEPEPAPEIETPPPVVRHAPRAVEAPPAPVEAAEPPQPQPEPLAVSPADPTPVAEPAPAPVATLAADSTVGTEAKGFSTGTSTTVGAKTGGPATQGAPGAVSVRGVVDGTADRSRAAGLAEGRQWDCPFPAEADDEGIDDARVTLQVQIGTDNSAQKVVIVNDPGFGFGQEARRCAMRRRWLSQLDRNGAPVAGMATVTVNFTR